MVRCYNSPRLPHGWVPKGVIRIVVLHFQRPLADEGDCERDNGGKHGPPFYLSTRCRVSTARDPITSTEAPSI